MKVVIIGGGLAGLSSAFHIEKFSGNKPVEISILERNERLGGLASSSLHNGFTFDISGHLLHLHNPYTTKWILNGLLKNNLCRHKRKSFIFNQKKFSKYPFQANLSELPGKTAAQCVAHFLKARDKFKEPSSNSSFAKWCVEVFGKGISKYFMNPYNRKLFCCDLNQMTAEWVKGFVPVPTREEVLYGAIKNQDKPLGYNALFYYPRVGGIQSLPNAIAGRLKKSEIYPGHEALEIDAKKRTVHTPYASFKYDWLINTSPLPFFAKRFTSRTPSWFKRASTLPYAAVFNLNLGVNRGNITDKHWIYFPEPKFPFYRVGVASNFTPKVAPTNATSFYIEFATRSPSRFDFNKNERAAIRKLESIGLLKSSDRILAKEWCGIDPGYVIFTKTRQLIMPKVMNYLKANNILSIGRYGAWKYSFMEEALLEGKQAAETILKNARRKT
ncbi:protoporphyrinogen/coproporphyrinogen oxidase [Elusimicrobiota bacterium]